MIISFTILSIPLVYQRQRQYLPSNKCIPTQQGVTKNKPVIPVAGLAHVPERIPRLAPLAVLIFVGRLVDRVGRRRVSIISDGL
jgi:hypothetical protein